MGLWVPPVSFDGYQSNITTPTTGTSVAASATPHSKNTTYTTLIASTDFDAYLIEMYFSDVSTAATDTSMLVDIAIGAAADETVVIPNLLVSSPVNFTPSTPLGTGYRFPLYIPSGSRISATAQAAVVSDTVLVTVKIWGTPSSPIWAGTQVTDYGTVLASSKGTNIASGVSSAEGAYGEIVAATSQTHYYLAAGIGLAADTAVASTQGLFDIGVGAATEDTVLEDHPFIITTAETMAYQPAGTYVTVASGTRLAARSSVADASAQNFDVIIYGVS